MSARMASAATRVRTTTPRQGPRRRFETAQVSGGTGEARINRRPRGGLTGRQSAAERSRIVPRSASKNTALLPPPRTRRPSWPRDRRRQDRADSGSDRLCKSFVDAAARPANPDLYAPTKASISSFITSTGINRPDASAYFSTAKLVRPSSPRRRVGRRSPREIAQDVRYRGRQWSNQTRAGPTARALYRRPIRDVLPRDEQMRSHRRSGHQSGAPI